MEITNNMWIEIDNEMAKMFENSDVIKHLFEDNMLEQIRIEMVLDILEIKMGRLTLTEKAKTIQQLVYAVKYSLLISKYESLEDYETCAEIRNEIITAMMSAYSMSRDGINQLFLVMSEHSKNAYEMLEKLINEEDYGE